MAHSETRKQHARRSGALAACWSCALLAFGCSVYDVSLLEQGPLADGGRAGGSILVNAGASSVGGANASTGGDGVAGGFGDDAGAVNGFGGAESGGASGASGASGGSANPGIGGNTDVGGSPAGGAGSLTLSMIDDMENPDQYIPTNDARVGYWSLSNDGSPGKQLPALMVMSTIPGGRGESASGLHTTSTGFTKTGAQVGVDLNRKGATRAVYNASAFKALHFWAKVESGSAKVVHLAILDKHTDPGGMLCCPTETSCMGGNIANGLCYDHFGKDLTLSNTWVEYTVPFSALSQVGWGMNDAVALDAAQVFNVQFNWGTAAMDLWLDDLAFVKK